MLDNTTSSVNDFIDPADNIVFSICPQKTDQTHITDFREISRTPREFCALIMQYPWSPIIFKNSYRLSSNFNSTSVIALDFDDGLTIAEVKEMVKVWQCWAVIGTTRSHQKEKVSGKSVYPPCDRFRLIMRAVDFCKNIDQYRYNMAAYINKLGADKACIDGARYFRPCNTIAYAQKGMTIDWLKLPADYYENQKRTQEREKQKMEMHKMNGTLPHFVVRSLTDPTGMPRHQTVWRISKDLTKLEYPMEQIVALVMKSPLAAIGEKDVREAVWYGATHGRDVEKKQHSRFVRGF